MRPRTRSGACFQMLSEEPPASTAFIRQQAPTSACPEIPEISSLTQAVADVSQQRIFAGLATDIQVSAVGVSGGRVIQPLTHAPLVIEGHWIRCQGGDVI